MLLLRTGITCGLPFSVTAARACAVSQPSPSVASMRLWPRVSAAQNQLGLLPGGWLEDRPRQGMPTHGPPLLPRDKVDATNYGPPG